jgi:hypothetical protein
MAAVWSQYATYQQWRYRHTSNGIQNDGYVEDFRLAPLVSEFLLKDLFLFISEVIHGGNLGRVLGSQSTLLEER